MKVFAWLKSLADASAVLARFEALLITAGFDFDALRGENIQPTALKDLIAQRAQTAIEAAVATANGARDAAVAVAEAAGGLAGTAKAEAIAAKAEFAGLLAALKAAGITFDAASADLAAAVRASVQARVTAAAAEKLAETGLPESGLPAQKPGSAAEDSLEDVRAQIRAEQAKERPDPRVLGRLANQALALRAKQSAKNS